MKFKMINDRAARVQVKGSILEEIIRKDDRYFAGSPTVTRNGCWIHKDAGGWVTIAAFGNDDRKAKLELRADLRTLERTEDKNIHPDLKD